VRVSEDEVEELLDRIADEARRARRPQDVQVTVASAGTLGIVVGADWSVLNHVPMNLDPPYMVSVGDDQGKEPGLLRRRRPPLRDAEAEHDQARGCTSCDAALRRHRAAIAGRDLGRGLAAALRQNERSRRFYASALAHRRNGKRRLWRAGPSPAAGGSGPTPFATLIRRRLRCSRRYEPGNERGEQL
jgi:hypothetical protein